MSQTENYTSFESRNTMSSCWTGPSANVGKTEGLDTDMAWTFTPTHGAKVVSGMSATTGWERCSQGHILALQLSIKSDSEVFFQSLSGSRNNSLPACRESWTNGVKVTATAAAPRWKKN